MPTAFFAAFGAISSVAHPLSSLPARGAGARDRRFAVSVKKTDVAVVFR